MKSIFRTRTQGTASSSSLSTDSPSPLAKPAKPAKSGNEKEKKSSQQNQLAHSNSLARREAYEKTLRQQYFEHGDRLSWDVQANLPLTLDGGDETFDDGDAFRRSENRCKKCNRIKEGGHVCPYSSTLQRSIGVMVYPSANAHVADEPGMLATALCEMNNFIAIKSGSFENGVSVSREKTPVIFSDGTIELPSAKIVANSDACSYVDVSPFRKRTLLAPATIFCKPIDDRRSDEEEGREDKQAEGVVSQQSGGEDLLFQPKMEITLDQYRAVTPTDDNAINNESRDFIYPQVPLTFTQRKSMSDALFSLCNKVPKLTDECAMVLTEARKRDEWDLAVAELMTQVICVLQCSPLKDYKLEGLRRYLLTLGIVC